MCSLTLGAGELTTPPPVEDLITSFETPSALALNGGFASDVILLLQTNLHRISIAAIGERGLHPVTSNSKNIPGPGIPRSKEGLAAYINTVYMFLTKFGEWEIEFTTISCTPFFRMNSIKTSYPISFQPNAPLPQKCITQLWKLNTTT